jgi:hypothetical protein
MNVCKLKFKVSMIHRDQKRQVFFYLVKLQFSYLS